jgi:toxin ParE1/3/4
MRLRYTLPALADLKSILDYIADRSPQGAAHIHTRIRAVTELILQYPLAGAVTDDSTIRRVATTPYPYLIFYETLKSSFTRCATVRAILPTRYDRSEFSQNHRPVRRAWPRIGRGVWHRGEWVVPICIRRGAPFSNSNSRPLLRAGSARHDLLVQFLIDGLHRAVDLGAGHAELIGNQLHQ